MYTKSLTVAPCTLYNWNQLHICAVIFLPYLLEPVKLVPTSAKQRPNISWILDQYSVQCLQKQTESEVSLTDELCYPEKQRYKIIFIIENTVL